MVAIQFKSLVSLVALCTLVSGSTVRRAQLTDVFPNAIDSQNRSSSTPGEGAKLPAGVHLDVHRTGTNGDNHNGQADDHTTNTNLIPGSISQRSVESTHNKPDDHKPNSNAGNGKSPTPDMSAFPSNFHFPRSVEKNKSAGVNPIPIHLNETQDKNAAVNNHAADGVSRKREHIEGGPVAETRIASKNSQIDKQVN